MVSTSSGGGSGVADADIIDDAAQLLAIAAIVDERPIGGASLLDGTTGGGTLEAARAAGRLMQVHSTTDFLSAVSGDTPTVILINEGTYDFTLSPGRAGQACTNPCDPNTPVAAETLAAASCPSTATLFDVESTYDIARVGDNKTLIGLGAGAILKNVELDLSGSSNIILRNLGLQDVNPGIFHDGEAIKLWPTDHVWIDHCSFKNISYTSLHIVSSWDEANNQALITAAGYMTISWNHFDGRTTKACGGQDPTVINTNRNPALTFHHNWFDTSANWNPFLFGPGTWGHLFNNTWTNITNISVAVSCDAAALLQGNAFESARDAIYINDNGAPTWSFCPLGTFGVVYAPTDTVSDEQNLLDVNSPLSLNGQSIDGTGLSLPVRQNGDRFRISVPASPTGGTAASYDYDLDANPAGVSAVVKAGCGVGQLF
jgi:pectate lyase